MPKRFAYLDGQKVPRKQAEKAQDPSGEPLEIVYVRKETLRAVWHMLGKGRSGNLNELTEDLLHRWLYEQEQRAHEKKTQQDKVQADADGRRVEQAEQQRAGKQKKAQASAARKKNRAFDER